MAFDDGRIAPRSWLAPFVERGETPAGLTLKEAKVSFDSLIKRGRVLRNGLQSRNDFHEALLQYAPREDLSFVLAREVAEYDGSELFVIVEQFRRDLSARNEPSAGDSNQWRIV
jgi:hypothetical protein